MYAPYKFQGDATTSYMEDALRRVHAFEDVFLLLRAGKKAMAKGNALSSEVMKKWKVDVKTNAETSTPSK